MHNNISVWVEFLPLKRSLIILFLSNVETDRTGKL